MLNAAAREDVQHTAYHDGNLMQQIGALLLELGRATLSLRMGQSPVRFSDSYSMRFYSSSLSQVSLASMNRAFPWCLA